MTEGVLVITPGPELASAETSRPSAQLVLLEERQECQVWNQITIRINSINCTVVPNLGGDATSFNEPHLSPPSPLELISHRLISS